MVRIWEVLKFYTSVSESVSKLLVEGLICELLLGIGINNVRGTSPCSVNEEPRIMSGSLNFFFNPTWTMNIELLKMTLDFLSAWANVHFSSKGRSFDRQADFTSVHKTLWSQKKKKKKNLNMHQLGYKFRISSYLFFSFCCLASLQELRIQVGGHHESFCIFWNLVFTPNKLSVYTEIKDWNTSKLTKTEYWNGVSCETRLPRVSEYFVLINFFFRCY